MKAGDDARQYPEEPLPILIIEKDVLLGIAPSPSISSVPSNTILEYEADVSTIGGNGTKQLTEQGQEQAFTG